MQELDAGDENSDSPASGWGVKSARRRVSELGPNVKSFSKVVGLLMLPAFHP